ncbi:acylase [candidate division KSB1 bacterium]|nr:acylase [candidate division KSB1 bacterium]
MKTKTSLLFVLALVGIGLVWRFTTPSVPPTTQMSQSLYDARILRDEWGVPHIFGKTDADVAYGLAYAHAEDDFETLQGVLLAARGKLASVYGKDAAPNDYMVQLLRIGEVVEAGYPQLSAEVRALCEAYAAGMNHYAALHRDLAHAELYPVTGKDLVAGFVHKVPLFFGIDKTLIKLLEPDTQRTTLPPPATSVKRFFDLTSQPIGSNTFSLSPRRTADRSTWLAVNSHQPWEGPVAWYEVHLHSDEGWNMVGGLLPGAPVVLHGHNRRLGWAHTVNTPDLVDVYQLEINPQNPKQYRFDHTWRDLEVREAALEVKLLGPIKWTFKREVLWSVHGPVIVGPHGTFALRFAGFGEVRHIEQWYRMNKARNFEEWKAAMRLNALPMFNTGYADSAGNIFYLYNGRIPLRARGYDWQYLVPGDTSATLWRDYLPFEQLPQVTNPATGFVQNCNSSPFQTTSGSENPQPKDYAAELGIETFMTNRALRALELFGSDSSITAEEFFDYKYDMTYSEHAPIARLVHQALTAAPAQDSLTNAALTILRAWDLRTDPENMQTALAMLAFRTFVDDDMASITTNMLLDSLRQAAHVLVENYGSLEVEWQKVNRLRRGEVDLGLGGGPDILHAVYGKPDGKGHLIGYLGDSYVLLVNWDAAGKVHSQSIHVYGSATANKLSKHYADQAPLFVERKLKPVWMEETEIRAHLEKEYRPGEELPK